HLHIDLKPIEKLQGGGTGPSRVDVSRDRGAYFQRPHAGELVLISDDDTGAVTWRLQPPTTDQAGGFRPTNLMEKVSRYVEDCVGGCSKRQVRENVGGKATYVAQATKLLVEEGFLHERAEGAGKASK